MKKYILYSSRDGGFRREEFKSYPKAFATMKERFTKAFVEVMNLYVHSAEMDPDHRLIETKINQRSMYLHIEHTGELIGFQIEEREVSDK